MRWLKAVLDKTLKQFYVHVDICPPVLWDVEGKRVLLVLNVTGWKNMKTGVPLGHV